MWRNRDVENCGKLDVRHDAPFDSTNARAMAGRYQFIVISESPNEYSKSIRGPLQLSVTDASHEFAAPMPAPPTGVQRPNDHVQLWGSAQLPSKGITIPWNY